MDRYKKMLIVNGKDKTDSIVSYSFSSGKCSIVYNNSKKVYSYNFGNVRVLNLQEIIDPNHIIVEVNGRRLSRIKQLLDYGDYYKIILEGGKEISFPRSEVILRENCLKSNALKNLFDYFKETAQAVSLVTENGINILGRLYEMTSAVSEETVLASFFNKQTPPKKITPPSMLIYPFGLNQSQRTAVENAFSSQVSIIQGPPGTGKTQTILNIIANAVRIGRSVAVVSNNNSAIQNVLDKLEKKQLGFLAAFLGSLENKRNFLESQSGSYPNMAAWVMDPKAQTQLEERTKKLSEELSNMLNAKNRIAEIGQELLQIELEQHHFQEYLALQGAADNDTSIGLRSEKILELLAEYEHALENNQKLNFIKKVSLLFRFNRAALRLFQREPELMVPYLQKQFYITRQGELTEEKSSLEKKLGHYSFDQKMAELAEGSMRLFKAELAKKYGWSSPRKLFEFSDFSRNSCEFCKEYPVILSTTYSIKSTLDSGHVYDYLIVDESSQVDLTTGVLAFSCARNIVIVGDSKQLPNVLTSDNIRIAETIWSKYSFDETYHFSTQSLLSAAVDRWPDAPAVLLREHYRCHPKVIGFCNQKFYDGKLIVMTKDHGESDALVLYRTVAGNHARGHMNQRQIDVIKEEVIPRLKASGYSDIGIITPYRDQVEAIRRQLGDQYEVATVHKFQGREKDAIILTSVDNVIGDFVDDPNMLNVAVSRAVHSLSVIVSQNPENDKTNYGDLERYIRYNNCEVINSTVFSVFDLLYKCYSRQRLQYLKKHNRVSEYDSENLIYSVIKKVLEKPEFAQIDCAIHVSLATLIRDYSNLSPDEATYARNPLTHTDFLLFRKMDRSPVMAIEVDGTSFHTAGSKQAERDAKKASVFMKCRIPLLRLRTNESGECERIESMLRSSL